MLGSRFSVTSFREPGDNKRIPSWESLSRPKRREGRGGFMKNYNYFGNMKRSDFTILVADDDPDYLFQTVFNLGKAGHKTITAESTPDVGTLFTVKLPKNIHS